MTRAEELPKGKSAGRVLLCLRAGEDVPIIQNILAGMAAEGVVCADLPDLGRRMMQEDVHAVLLTEAALAEGTLRPLAEALQNQPQWSDLPVLFVAGGGLDAPLALQVVRELPNVLVLDRPIRMATLASALQMALRMRAKQRQVRDLLDERQRAQEALEQANERLHAQTDDLASVNEQLLTEREELQRQSAELHKQSLALRELKEQAERTARTMEKLARSVEENPDPTLRVRADGRIQYKNQASFGLCRQWNPDDRLRVPPAVQEIVSEAHAREKVVRREVAVVGHTYLVTAAPAPSPARYVNIFVHDITERRQAAEALRESEERLHLALGAARMGAWQWEVGTQRVAWSPEIHALLGYEPGRVTPSHEAFRQRIHPEDFAHWEQAMRESLERCEDYACEFRVVWPDGSVHWVEARGQYTYPRDESATETVWIRGVLSDIKQRKQAEEALRRSEEQFHRFFEDDLTGNFISTPEGEILLCNPAFAAIFGFSRAVEAMGTSMADLYLDPAERAALLERLRKEGRIERLEVWRRRRDGAPIHIIENLVGHFDEQGELHEIKGYIFENTQRKRAEEALRELTATLESKVTQRTAELRHRTRQLQKLALEMSEAEDRERERLAHILHEDLQQELAAAKFHLSLARHRIKSDAATEELIATVVDLLKDAINKSRGLSHELSPVVLQQGDFAEALHWLAGEMQAKHSLVVRVHGRAYLPSDGIKAFLYRAAQELLFNAVKHAQVREARVRIRQCGGYVCLSVSDRGRGFDPEKLRETAGFGLLSIRERIELLGGRMKIRSAPGRGSTFFVVVPGGTPAEDRGQKTEDGRETGEGALSSVLHPPSSVLRVLLADDHEVVRQGLIALFGEEETLQVIGEAANGREAVDLADRLRPDVVLMDVSMPVMSGEEATREIKRDLPQTRIVSLSMREEPEVRERMQQAGADSYVLKTAPYKDLLAAIRGKESDS